ncbi:MAG: sensor histidine kinase [Polyangiaceae bacterium]
MEQATPGTSWAHPEQTGALLDAWRVYDDHYDRITVETRDLLDKRLESGIGPRSESAAGIAATRELLRRAIEDGDWSPYEDHLRARVESYTQHGLTLAGWHATAYVVTGFVTLLVLQTYRDDPPRAEAAVVAIQRLHDWRAAVLGEHFLSANENRLHQAESALRRSERDLQRAEKLASVGKLAGGVAHDFNNLLTIILSNMDLLHRRVAHDGHALDNLEEVRKTCARAAELARQLMIVSREQTVKPTLVDFNQVVEDSERTLTPVLGVGVSLVLQTTRPLGGVKMDRGSLERVITNLVFNARDAMPEGGRVMLMTKAVFLERGRHRKSYGDHAMLSVKDDGVGMDTSTLARVFEPFFTTKEPGKGTGLGLAIVHGIVEQARGFVEVRSKPGHGTTFDVYVPCVGTSPRVPRRRGRVRSSTKRR